MMAVNIRFDEVPIDRKEVPDALLNIDDKVRSNLFPWNGQFSPQLAEVLLEAYGSNCGIILDPFVGSGTVAYEAGRLGLGMIGTEINPAAHMMARVYELINVEPSRRNASIAIIEAALQGTFKGNLPLFDEDRPLGQEDVIKCLVGLREELTGRIERSLLEALIVRLDFYKPGLNVSRVASMWVKLKASVQSLPYSCPSIQILNNDARSLPIESGTIDLVLTSPPYINVFNYHQQYRASAEALGWNLLQVAQSEIGSNRKHRGNRFLTVIQYCLDLAQVMVELRRVCHDNSRVIFVVGRESNVRGTRFLNGEIVARIAVYCAGFSLSLRQERVFTNRFGMRIYEDVLHFDGLGKAPAEPIQAAREIACDALNSALQIAQGEVSMDIRGALDRLHSVQSSPLFESQKAKTANRC